ncbi:hypothetical protein LSAT2_010934 [Lamellibrachia satsuma]|nr:hypothetical protein LSAT2_010934 [Lamellibrachia satsuma]
MNRFLSQRACMMTCRVKKRRCSPVMCMLYCKYGFKRDQYGCPICACRRVFLVSCQVKKRRCSPFMCMLYCKSGFKRDQYGCPICACRFPQTGLAKP